MAGGLFRKFFELQPEFFDIFGLPVFFFVGAVALRALTGHQLPRWAFMVLLGIGIVGVVIDGIIVYRNYLR